MPKFTANIDFKADEFLDARQNKIAENGALITDQTQLSMFPLGFLGYYNGDYYILREKDGVRYFEIFNSGNGGGSSDGEVVKENLKVSDPLNLIGAVGVITIDIPTDTLNSTDWELNSACYTIDISSNTTLNAITIQEENTTLCDTLIVRATAACTLTINAPTNYTLLGENIIELSIGQVAEINVLTTYTTAHKYFSITYTLNTL